MPAHNHDGVGGMHMYLPWWKFDRKNDFLRGYHTEFGGGRGMPGIGDSMTYAMSLRDTAGAEAGMQEKIRHIDRVRRAWRDDPNENCYCEIDPGGRQVGHSRAALPLEVERQRNQDGEGHAGDLQEIVEAAGGIYLTERKPDGRHPYGIADGGEIIHEVGTVRMGERRATSALNGYCQAHDVKNLFVTDGASFVTNADKNPTLTIMALTWRASDYLLAEAKKGNL